MSLVHRPLSSTFMASHSTHSYPQLLSVADLYRLLQPITVPLSSPRSRFSNWAETFTCKPLALFEPENEDQCELILELARREGKPVRAVGVGHSPSDLACTNGFMLRTTKLNRVLEVSALPVVKPPRNAFAEHAKPGLPH
jgi:L-gulonolactone oxidase